MLNHIGTTTIETKRLILRRFKESDALPMFNHWASDSEVTQYLTWSSHESIDVTEDILNLWIEAYQNKESYQWAIELKEIGAVIGSISLMAIDNHNENGEIGYCIGKAWWNQGVVTEAFKAILDVSFNEIGLARVMARHHIDNPASGRVMEKCGLVYEGTMRKVSKNNRGELIDCKYYAILKDEYLA